MFQWTWGGDILRFELNPTTGGTTMTFTTWLESPDLDVAAGAAGGYHVCLNQLRVLLDTGSAPHSSRAKQLPDASDVSTRSNSL